MKKSSDVTAGEGPKGRHTALMDGWHLAPYLQRK